MIGYIDPGLPQTEQQTAKAQLEKAILDDVNYVEISIRSTTTRTLAPYDLLSYYIDGLELHSELVYQPAITAAP